MSVELPDPIASFFAVSNGADPAALERCFTDDALVRDERQTHQGRTAIAAWLREVQRKLAYRAEPLHAAREGSLVRVRARVTGTFPGSPVELDHVFRLGNGGIESLEIG
jgi:hypothetical protein